MERIKSITRTQVFDILKAAPDAWRDKLDIDAAATWWADNKDQRTMDALKVLAP